MRGADVSKAVVEGFVNSRGFLIIAEKNQEAVEGKYEVIGFLQSLRVNEDGITRSENENGGAIIVTASCIEPWFELNLVGTPTTTNGHDYSLSGAKTAFNALLGMGIV